MHHLALGYVERHAPSFCLFHRLVQAALELLTIGLFVDQLSQLVFISKIFDFRDEVHHHVQIVY
jgi:hypothetical protein